MILFYIHNILFYLPFIRFMSSFPVSILLRQEKNIILTDICTNNQCIALIFKYSNIWNLYRDVMACTFSMDIFMNPRVLANSVKDKKKMKYLSFKCTLLFLVSLILLKSFIQIIESNVYIIICEKPVRNILHIYCIRHYDIQKVPII